MKMNKEQFEALSKMMKLRNGKAKLIAYLVIVEGYEISPAAKSIGISYIAAHQAVKRVKKALETAKGIFQNDYNNNL